MRFLVDSSDFQYFMKAFVYVQGFCEDSICFHGFGQLFVFLFGGVRSTCVCVFKTHILSNYTPHIYQHMSAQKTDLLSVQTPARLSARTKDLLPAQATGLLSEQTAELFSYPI